MQSSQAKKKRAKRATPNKAKRERRTTADGRTDPVKQILPVPHDAASVALVPEILDEANLAIASRSELQQIIMREAGLSLKDVRLAGDRLREALDAMVTKLYAHQGRVVDERNLIDWTTRLTAVRELFSMFDLRGSKKDTRASARKIKVEVDLAPDLKRLRATTG